jgi:uncharacterized protein with gpF-like domain
VKPLRSPGRRSVVVRPIRANAGVEASYRAALQGAIDDMARSVQYWLKAAWRDNPPIQRGTMAADTSPVKALQRALSKLSRAWIKRFDDLSVQLATRFADKSVKHTNTAMQAALTDAGFAIEFKMTAGATEALNAVVAENVGLIRSIPQKYLQAVEQRVWQTVAQGSDLNALANGLKDEYGITWKRAKLIARDQNTKATAAIEAARRQDLGIRQAIWVHSGAGKEPRPSHVQAGADKLVFDLDKGAYLDGEWVLPGYAINCRCTSRAIIPGLDD